MSFGAVAAGVAGIAGGMIAAGGAKSAAGQTAAAARDANALQQYQYDTTRQDQAPWRTVGNNALNELAIRMGLGTYRGEAPTVQSIEEIRANMQNQYGQGGTANGGGDMYGVRFFGPEQSMEYVPIPTGGANADQVEAAVQAEYQRQQQALNDFNAQGAGDRSNPLYGSLTKNFGLSDFQTDPGYEFRKAEGMKGIENSAAARGGLLSGAALKAAGQYNQDFASNEFGNAYNRFNTNQTNNFNRLATLAGVGQTANNAVQSAGQNYANNAGANLVNAGNAAAAGAQRASGYMGQALGFAGNQLQNAWGNYNGGGYSGAGSLFGSGNASPVTGLSGGNGLYAMGTNYGFG